MGGILVSLAAALLFQALAYLPFFTATERVIQDRALGSRAAPSVSKDITLILYDEKSDNELHGLTTPALAEVMGAVASGGAVAIAPMVFLDGSRDIKEFSDDRKLEDLLSRYAILLMARFNEERGEVEPPYGPFAAAAGPGDVAPLVIRPDNDGIVRHIPLWFDEKNGGAIQKIPAYPLIVASRLSGKPFHFAGEAVFLGEQALPLEAAGLRINYRAPGEAFMACSFSEALASAERSDKGYFRERFGGKAVIIGRSVNSASDFLNVPASLAGKSPMARAEILASAVATMACGVFIKKLPFVLEGIIAVFIALMAFSSMHFLGRSRGILINSLVLLLMGLLSFFLIKYLSLEVRITGWALALLAVTLWAMFFSCHGSGSGKDGNALPEKGVKPCEVFISYASSDTAMVMKIAGHLEKAGMSLWIDKEGIRPARMWEEQIVEAIDACKVLVVMASKQAYQSHNIVKEVTLASEAKKPILPVYLEEAEVPPNLRYQLAGIQHIELYQGSLEDHITVILKTLESHGVTVGREGSI
ncbi:MAG: TIR domain-containing protein [Candidatus Eremiobacteraeota bacterium]|nr:TIR domain-containing protein [Candidatus Eremiobacteraeota bacterium]